MHHLKPDFLIEWVLNVNVCVWFTVSLPVLTIVDEVRTLNDWSLITELRSSRAWR